MHRTGNKIHIMTGVMDIDYLSKTGSLEKNETEIFGLGISLVGILCRLLRPGFHILSYLLQLSTPQLHNLYTLSGLTRVFLMRKQPMKYKSK